MPEKTINCQNLACPGPVIEAKKYIEAEKPVNFTVIVDNEPAKENVSRLMASFGYSVAVTENSGLFHLSAAREGELLQTPEPFDCDCDTSNKKILVLVCSEFFGTGDDVLGQKLMRNFLLTLKELGPALWRIIFLNGGVKLCIAGSSVIDVIQELESEGVSILACGTCLEHFGLLEQKAAGQTTNMLDVVTSMQLAGKVLHP